MSQNIKIKGKNPYDVLAFTLTQKCSAQCEICCFESSPTCTMSLDINRVREYINSASKLDYIKTIAFTGGEPFLIYNDLRELIKLASLSGKRVTTITNGYWASNYDLVITKIKELKERGLNHLSISYDSYHSEYIDVNNIRNILKATMQLGLPTSLAIVKLKDEKVSEIIDSLDDCLYATNLEIVPCLPVGAAKKNFKPHQFEKIYESNSQKLRCTYNGMLVVLYDGRILPCCSQAVVDTGLCIGDFNELSLEEALFKAKNNKLLYALRNSEMRCFYEYIKNFEDIELPDRVVNPCELCAHLFSPKLISRHKQLFDNHETS